MKDYEFEFTHFRSLDKQDEWFVYRRNRLTKKQAWVVYMGPFANESSAKVKAERLTMNYSKGPINIDRT